MTVTTALETLAALPDVTVFPATEADAVDGVPPAVVVRPARAAAVSRVLRAAAAHGWRVVPRGGGTALDLGNTPRGVDLVLDLSALTAVVEYRPQDLTVTVEAGATVAAVQALLATRGQVLALDPPLPERATVGGALAANLTGPRRLRYGTARDIVIGTGAVLADGSEVKAGGRVVKNVAGYDLNKLFIGSVGTLGVITRVTFKLLPAPPERAALVLSVPEPEAACRLARQIASSTLAPLALDIAGPGALALPASHPAHTATDRWSVVVEIGGTPAMLARTRAELLTLARAVGATPDQVLDGEAVDALMGGLRDFGRTPGREAALLLRVAVLPSQVGEVIELLAAMTVDGAPPALVARAGNGVVYATWTRAADPSLPATVERLRRELARLHGVLVVERCPTAVKQALDVWGIEGADVTLMRRLKKAYDPTGILSPGRGPGHI
jgi:glycolate oxidase FAD binding subunit